MIEISGKYFLYRWIRHDKNCPFYIGMGTKDQGLYYSRAFCIHTGNDILTRICSKTTYTVQILLESNSRDFIIQKEIEFIKIYGRINNNTGILVNLTDGGNSVPKNLHSEKSRDKAKKSLQLLHSSPYYINRNKGRIVSQETRDKISRSHIGKKLSKETIEKMKLKTKGRRLEKNFKPVFKYSLDGNFLEEFTNTIDASKSCKGDVYNAASGRNKSAGGFQWKNYKTDRIDSIIDKIETTKEDKIRIKPIISNPIYQCDLNGDIVREWTNVTIAALELKISRSGIANCLVNISKTSSGFKWKYKINKIKKDEEEKGLNPDYYNTSGDA